MRISKYLLLTIALTFLLSGCMYAIERPIVNLTEEKIPVNLQLTKKIYLLQIENVKVIKNMYLLSSLMDEKDEKALEEQFKSNIELTLINAGYLQPLEPESEFLLVVTIKEFERPGWGSDMTAKFVFNYRLTNRAGKVIFDKSIQSEKTVKFSESWTGSVRSRKATLGAERENYVKFMAELGTLKIPPQEDK